MLGGHPWTGARVVFTPNHAAGSRRSRGEHPPRGRLAPEEPDNGFGGTSRPPAPLRPELRPGYAGTPVQVVLVEDSPDYAALVTEMLREQLGPGVRVAIHRTLDAAHDSLRNSATDCVLLDLSLPDARGLEGLERIQSMAPHTPVVVLSGDADERTAIEAVSRGAQDYLVKRDARAGLLVRSIRYAMERKRVELELSFLAMHDSLTGLANRALFIDRLHLALARSQRSGTWVAVVFIDLDRFKAVNDHLGHELGDMVLIDVAKRLRELMRPVDTVARFGGDEFMVLCDELESEADAVRIAERITTGMEAPFRIGGHDMHIGVSAGVAIASDGVARAEVLIRDADQTMYRAKRESRRFALYDEAAHADSLERLELENELHGALERGELRLHYQPLVGLGTGGAIEGLEALVRWEHPERGLLHPVEFLDIAAETRLIFEIGEWVLGEACQRLAEWARAGHDLVISVNLSPQELLRPELPAAVAASLERTGLDPARLCLEVTEHSVASDSERLVAVLAGLRRTGVRVAMDDFGTGHSSLSALAAYPLDIVKLDRSFVARLNEDERHVRMLKAVVEAAHAFALTAIAEGVEDEQQLATVRAVGCDAAQGFLFARPAPAEEITRLLNAG
jgi:diguanylate cyclase (GGDEF)-like protein